MPLVKGSSKKAIGSNIAEMMKSFKKSGMIGKVKPKSKKKAVKIAAAASYNKAKRKKKVAY